MENHDEVEVLLKKYDGIIRKIVNRYKVSNFDKEDLEYNLKHYFGEE